MPFPRPLLKNVQVAAPCPMRWQAMRGDARVRFCNRCERNVYNLSAMTRSEARELIQAHRANLCVRYYARADGTLVTADCPTRTWVERLQAGMVQARVPALKLFLGVVVVVLLVATLFGDNLRRMFGEATTGALVGNPRGDHPGAGDLVPPSPVADARSGMHGFSHGRGGAIY